MKLVNNISIRTFCTPEEDYEDIEEAFFKLLGYSKDELKKEKIVFSERNAKGFNDKTIKILEATLEKDRQCNKFLENLSEHLDDDDRELLMSQDNRLDEHLDFFMRLDKTSLLVNQYVVVDSGDCFHIKINIAAFPRKKDVARNIIRDIFS